MARPMFYPVFLLKKDLTPNPSNQSSNTSANREMRAFAILLEDLSLASDEDSIINLLHSYLITSNDQDRIEAIKLICGYRPKRLVSLNELHKLALQKSDLPIWLFERSLDECGDLCEAISYALPRVNEIISASLSQFISELLQHQTSNKEEKIEFVHRIWQNCTPRERYLANRLISGTFRKSISPDIVVRSIHRYTNMPCYKIATRLNLLDLNDYKSFENLFCNPHELDSKSQPNEFRIESPFEFTNDDFDLGQLLKVELLEGLNCQVVKRNNRIFLWLNECELINRQFEVLIKDLINIPRDFVILGRLAGRVIGENWSTIPLEKITKSLRKPNLENFEILVLCHDIIEIDGKKVTEPASIRLSLLEEFLEGVDLGNESRLALASVTLSLNKKNLTSIRSPNTQAIYRLKQSDKSECDYFYSGNMFSLKGVLLYVHRKEGMSSNRFINYTFAVRKRNDELVPIVKVYEGLNTEDHNDIAEFAKQNTIERFGPTRSVVPEIVAEIRFRNIEKSPRRKSGVVLIDPVIHSLRKNLSMNKITRLAEVKNLLSTN